MNAPLILYLVKPGCDGFCFLTLYFILSCLVVISFKLAFFFLVRDRKGVESKGGGNLEKQRKGKGN